MNHSPLSETTPLPATIVAALNNLIGRTRRLVILRGLCASCAAGIGAFLLIMLLDASVTLLAPWPRWIMTLLAYATWAGATLWFLIRPLTHSFTLAGIARLIETHHPELQERISSAVQLLSSRDLPSIRGSDTLIAALTEEAVRETLTLQPRQEISFRSAIPFVIATAVVLTVLTALCLIRPRETGFLLARATAPFLNLPNVQAVDLVVDPGDTLVAAGSSLQISLKTANTAVSFARLRQMDRQGHETVTDMMALPALTNQPGRRFAVTLPRIPSEFQYRVHAGDALSRYFTVRVATPPVIEHLDIHYRYPDYSRLGVKQERDGSGTIRALAGTTVALTAQVNKPVRLALLLINTPTLTNTFTGILRTVGKDTFYDFSLPLPKGLNGGWTIRLTDEINLTNTPFEHPIQTIPDTPPVVTVTSPLQKELHLNGNARLPVAYRAEDDYGLTAMAIVFTLPGSTNELIRSLPMPAAPTEAAPKTLSGEVPVVMEDPLFSNAQRITVRIRASDTLPATAKGPQSADSEPITLILDNQAASWTEQVLASQEQRVQQGLKQVQQKLTSARDQARALNNPQSLQQPLTDDTTRKIDTLQDTLAAADNALRDIATDIDKGFFAALASNLTALAENHVGKAENMAGQIRLVDTPTERMSIISNITTEVATSLDTLDRAIQDHELARSAVHRAVELDQLADTQAALAQARQDMDKAPPIPASNTVATAQAAATAKEWKRVQDQVADELAKVARTTPGSAAQIATAISNLTVQAALQASELAKRQNDLAALTQAESDRLRKWDSQWRELASRQNQLADLAKNEPLAVAQNDSMRSAARDLASDNKEQAVKTQADVTDALKQAADNTKLNDPEKNTGKPGSPRELAAHAAALKAAQQANGKPEKITTKADTKQAARQAQEAGKLAQQAALNAGQAQEKARGAAQVTEQQAATAKQNAQKSSQTAEQATQQAQQAKGKSTEQELNRSAEIARQNAAAALQNDTAARDAAQQAKQAAQAAEQQSQKAQQASQAAQQAAQKATEYAQKAASATSARAAQQARDETAKAAASATANAMTATEAALQAHEAADRARQQTDMLKLAELARQQEELRREAAGLITEKQIAKEALRATLSQQITEQHQEQQEHLTEILASDRPLEALQEQQELLGQDVKALAQVATLLSTEARDSLSQAGPQTAQAVQELGRAAQSAEQAANRMKDAAGRDAGQTYQHQQSAGQSLQQAASALKQAATASSAPPPTAPELARQLSASPAAQQAIAQAYQAARQAAQNSQAADASQAAAQLAQAADQAAAAAQSKGANARPATLQSASSNRGSGRDLSQASEGVPSFAHRMGLKLQDWLRLNGELKDDVLQASNAEGPEEYRPIIQRYFHEVSGHGEEE